MSDLPSVDHIEFPTKYPFAAYGGTRFAPMLVDGRKVLRELEIDHIREQYSYAVLEHPKPTYLMLPVMMLVVAEQLGGITEKHQAYLPWLMLGMELGAILDDTVDRNPLRAGRPTYSEKYGEASAASFTAYLQSTMSLELHRRVPAVLPIVLEFFQSLSRLEVWEHHNRYPSIEVENLQRWNRCRTDANGPGVAMAIDGALVLHGRPRLSKETYQPFSDLMQDVDDIVHIVEDRENNGELSDLRVGVVTAPLVHALRVDPELPVLLERFWTPYRSIPTHSRSEYRERMARQSALDKDLYYDICARIKHHGVHKAVEYIYVKGREFVEKGPPELKSCLEIAVTPWTERARTLAEALNMQQSLK